MKTKELIYHREEQDKILSDAYSMLSEAGFDLLIEDGCLSVWMRGCKIECDIEEGMVIVPYEYQDEFDERQEQLQDEEE
jgi:hypothetical protein